MTVHMGTSMGTGMRQAARPVREGEGFAESAVPLLVVLVEVQSEAEALQRLVVTARQLK